MLRACHMDPAQQLTNKDTPLFSGTINSAHVQFTNSNTVHTVRSTVETFKSQTRNDCTLRLHVVSPHNGCNGTVLTDK